MDTFSIFLILVIAACLIGIIVAVEEVRGWWRAWNIEEQKRRPVIGDTAEIHVDKKV
jgi:hypothetical protein